ncbi:MAG: tRNA uridine-5-carboxymethylaminomethyl(34) synthesis GTPase MnmE [Parvibaculum sp.]
METIYALASGRGRGAVAIVRISGSAAGHALACLSGRGVGVARVAEVRRLCDPVTGAALDEALVLGFEGPHSFTGEDVVELHIHGGLAVIDSVLEGLGKVEGLRPAVAGEFTRRAVENGKFDLSVAEGIGDLVEAESSAQQAQALRQMRGAFGAMCDGWRQELIRALAYIEAEIDFADEDLPSDLARSVAPIAEKLIAEMESLLRDDRGEKTRDGIFVAVLGAPNVGKSSLVNWLAGRDAVIVSDIAGTTRDVVEVRLTLGGQAVTICDTAGLRKSDDLVESEGIRRARKVGREADLRLWLSSDGVVEVLETSQETSDRDLFVRTKADLVIEGEKSDRKWFPVSVKSGFGLETLLTELSRRIEDRFGGLEAPVISRARHRSEIATCRECLARGLTLLGNEGDLSLAAEEFRRSVRAIGRVTGVVDVEDLLDVVFRDFCIGK